MRLDLKMNIILYLWSFSERAECPPPPPQHPEAAQLYPRTTVYQSADPLHVFITCYKSTLQVLGSIGATIASSLARTVQGSNIISFIILVEAVCMVILLYYDVEKLSLLSIVAGLSIVFEEL